PFLGRVCSHRSPLSCLLAGTAALASLGAMSVNAQTAAALPETSRHLFGQVSQPAQIGQGYVVLERTGDRVYGALYYPSSSFDCFYGQLEGAEMAMTIVNSYDQETYPYALALANGPAVAAIEGAGELSPFSLSGFFAIDNISDNDHRMLDVCRSAVVTE
ncbi:MAG: hypothetical protein WBG38_08970, partial [Nodosilinea sp.]